MARQSRVIDPERDDVSDTHLRAKRLQSIVRDGIDKLPDNGSKHAVFRHPVVTAYLLGPTRAAKVFRSTREQPRAIDTVATTTKMLEAHANVRPKLRDPLFLTKIWHRDTSPEDRSR